MLCHCFYTSPFDLGLFYPGLLNLPFFEKSPGAAAPAQNAATRRPKRGFAVLRLI
jgi:hypothetical protein